jgi:hypothetical protein
MIKYFLVWTGTKFHPKYIQVIANKLHKSTLQEHSFVIFTDKPHEEVLMTLSMISSNLIETYNVSEYELDGYFNKLLMFKYLEESDSGFDALYFDLDVIILLGSMDHLIQKLRENVGEYSFGVLRNFQHEICENPPALYQSSMLYFGADYAGDVWYEFNKKRQYYLTKHKPIGYGDQTIIEEIDPEGVIIQDFLDRPDRIVSFKIPRKRWNLTEGIWIVIFHGVPSIAEASKGSEWIRHNWQY